MWQFFKRKHQNSTGVTESEVNTEIVDGLVAACEEALIAIKNEWLYQTGQFSRIMPNPTNYPPQGSVDARLIDAQTSLRAAIAKARGAA